MQAVIGIDWGTSSLRATLFTETGTVREERRRAWGIGRLPPCGFDAALDDVCAGWPAAPILASGMIGSRQGWREVGYVNTPADTDLLIEGTVTFRSDRGRTISIVPGVRNPETSDVMRGEETEIAGALTMCPELSGSSRLVLPGSHSKWVDIQCGKIVGFATMMTGELHSALLRHTILGADVPGDSPDAAPDAFDEGVQAARGSCGAGALTRIFSARALVLDSRLDCNAVPSYLSGLLIGEEWRAMLASGWLQTGRPPALVGDPRLCALYQRAAMLFDLPRPAALSGAAATGLWRIHVALEKQRAGVSVTRTSEHR
jgi:2-dehydro-3-deoxygalactonokinase